MEKWIILLCIIAGSVLFGVIINKIMEASDKKKKTPVGPPPDPISGEKEIYLDRILSKNDKELTLSILSSKAANSDVKITSVTILDSHPFYLSKILKLQRGFYGTKVTLALIEELADGATVVDCVITNIQPEESDTFTYIQGTLSYMDGVKKKTPN